MLLTVSVGNTHVRMGIFQGKRLVKNFSLATPQATETGFWKRQLSGFVESVAKLDAWEGAIATGVIPNVQPALTRALKQLFKKNLWISAKTPLPLENAYQPAGDLGSDRLVGAAAAVEQYGAPVIVVDAGTAITLNAVDTQNRFIGGAILPGFEASLSSLARRTAQVPEVTLKKPRGWIGRSTQESLRTGIVAGTGGAVSFLLSRMGSSLGSRPQVVGTGGAIRLLLPYCPEIKHTRPHLILEGLQSIWSWQSLRSPGGRHGG